MESGNTALKQEIVSLKAENAALKAEILRLQEEVRASKRPTAPFTKGAPKADPKKPGRARPARSSDRPESIALLEERTWSRHL